MIRILHSVSNMDRAGIETMLMNYYRRMDRSRIQFDFLVNKPKPGDYDDEIRSLGGRIFVSPGLRPDQFPSYVRFFRRLVAENPDIKILHAHNEGMSEYALAAALLAGISVRIAHAHNTHIQHDWKWPWKVICKSFIPFTATHYFACGNDAGIYYFGKRRWAERGVILRNAIEPTRFAFSPHVRQAVRQRMEAENRFVVGHVGRFCRQKNHRRLLKIFASLLAFKPNALLWLAGEGELLPLVQADAARLGIASSVRFLGLRDDIANLCQAMDVFVFPSLYEGLGLAAIEAQATGLPCVFSENVPEEAAILPASTRIPLSASDDVWAHRIAAFDMPNPTRPNAMQILLDAGYDIEMEALHLSDFYLHLASRT